MGGGGPSGTASMEQGIKKAGQVGRDAFVCFMSLPPTLKGEDRLLPFVASSNRITAQAVFGNMCSTGCTAARTT